MKKQRSPAFSFYPKDWLSDKKVKRLSWKAKGIYIELLAIMWNEGHDSIEDDPDEIAAVLKIGPEEWLQVRLELQGGHGKIFAEKDQKLISKRLRSERRAQRKFSKKKSEAGKKGANSKWHRDIQQPPADGTAIVLPMAKDGSSSSSSSPSSSPLILKDGFKEKGEKDGLGAAAQVWTLKAFEIMESSGFGPKSPEQVLKDRQVLRRLAIHIESALPPQSQKDQYGKLLTLLQSKYESAKDGFLTRPFGAFRKAAGKSLGVQL